MNFDITDNETETELIVIKVNESATTRRDV